MCILVNASLIYLEQLTGGREAIKVASLELGTSSEPLAQATHPAPLQAAADTPLSPEALQGDESIGLALRCQAQAFDSERASRGCGEVLLSRHCQSHISMISGHTLNQVSRRRARVAATVPGIHMPACPGIGGNTTGSSATS